MTVARAYLTQVSRPPTASIRTVRPLRLLVTLPVTCFHDVEVGNRPTGDMQVSF